MQAAVRITKAPLLLSSLGMKRLLHPPPFHMSSSALAGLVMPRKEHWWTFSSLAERPPRGTFLLCYAERRTPQRMLARRVAQKAASVTVSRSPERLLHPSTSMPPETRVAQQLQFPEASPLIEHMDDGQQISPDMPRADAEEIHGSFPPSAEKLPLYRLPKGLLPQGRVMKVMSSEFIKSSSDVSQCPQNGYPEIAVIGRSNVGKSSLINMLTNRRALAQTSKKPGKTQLINHFLINGKWYLVDLPGYGYAVAPNAVREDWHAFTQNYFLSRPNLVTVFLLVDASIPPMQVDLDCADWLGQNKIPLTILFTKCDRRKKRKNGGRPPSENAAEFERRLGDVYEEPPPWIMTSSVVGMGKDVLLGHISQLIQHWKS